MGMLTKIKLDVCTGFQKKKTPKISVSIYETINIELNYNQFSLCGNAWINVCNLWVWLDLATSTC